MKNKLTAKPETDTSVVSVKEPSIEVSEVSQESLVKVWQEYLEQLKKEERSAELSVINQPFEIKGDAEIILKLGSGLQVDILEKFKSHFVNFLRNSLNNPQIKIRVEIVQEETKQRLYTSQDKFNYMVERNPKLMELRNRLGLEYDY